jgi:hypothetical protein
MDNIAVLLELSVLGKKGGSFALQGVLLFISLRLEYYPIFHVLASIVSNRAVVKMHKKPTLFKKGGIQMGRIEESIEIKCPVDKVFAYTTIAENWPKWHDEILEAEQTSQGEVGVGTTFRVKTHSMSQTTDWTSKVTEYVQDKKWGKELSSKSAIIEDQLIFGSIEGGTKFTMIYDVKVGGFAKLLSSKIDSETRKELKQDLINLKGILESET